MNLLKDFHLVELESPYDQWESEIVRHYFCEMVRIKKLGYGSNFPSGVMATDGSDFFGRHYLVCKKGPTPQVVMIWKSTRLSECRKRYQSFPMLSLAQSGQSQSHIDSIKQLVATAEKENGELIYSGSFTIDPEFKKDKNLWTELRNFLSVLHYFDFLEVLNQRKTFLGAAVVRFGMDTQLMEAGFVDILGLNGKKLEIFESPFLAGERVRFIEANQFSEECRGAAEKLFGIWKDRKKFKKERSDIRQLKVA